MTPLEIILGLVFSIGLLMYLAFRNKNRKTRDIYTEKMDMLQAQLEINKKQLRIRAAGLNRYDFLKYNLLDALIVQSEIRL